jgi:hypothetical protein
MFLIARIEASLSACLAGGKPARREAVLAPPQNADHASCVDFRFLGLLPTPVEHRSDITRPYIEQYGVPPAKPRVFIRTWQQVVGSERRAQMRLTNALVPTRGAGLGQKRDKITRRTPREHQENTKRIPREYQSNALASR